MNRLIKVADLIDNHTLEMSSVLRDLKPDAHGLQWSILDLGEVIAEDRWDLNMPVIEASVTAAPTGMQLSFDDLEAFAGRIRQVIDGLFVGCHRPNLLPRRDQTDAESLARAEMLVAAIDSSFWLLSAQDDVLARIERRFERVETVNVADVGLSTWERRP